MGRTSDAKERLMTAILDLVAEGSYGTLRVDDICKAADVKKGSFYYFFPSKEALVIAALEHLWETESKPMLDRFFSPSLPPLERLRKYYEHIVRKAEEEACKCGCARGCHILSLASEVVTQDKDVSATASAIFARKRRYLESCIRDAIAEGEIPPGDAAARVAGLWALTEGVFVESRVLNDLEPIRHLPTLALTFLKAKVTEPTAS